MNLRNFAERQVDLESAGNTWQLWVMKAQDLLASTVYLGDLCPFRKYLGQDNKAFQRARGSVEEKASRVVPMLWGTAAECLLKALWLKSGKTLISGGRYQKIPETNDHNLDQLALALNNEFGIPFSDDEIGLLFKLSGSNVSGRYPVPKNASTRKPLNTEGKVLDVDFESWRYPADDDLVEAFFSRLWESFASTDAT